MCFRGSITQQLHSLCTLRSAGHPTTTQHSVPGGGHLSRAAVETLQGSIERFQFFIHSPLPGLAWRTCRSDKNVDVDVDMNLNVNATLDVDVDMIRSSS
jgi:hypothetical protein